MKTLHNKIKIVIGVFLLAALVVSCVPEQQSMGGAGQTLVKLVSTSEDGYFLFAINASSVSQTVMAFDIRRNCANESDLLKETTLTLQLDNTDTAMLKAYNHTYETSYVPLPAGSYSTLPAIASNKITLVYAPGELAKQVKFVIPNAAGLDLSKSFGVALKATVVGSGVWSETTNDTILAHIMPKNKYDGIYTLKGKHNRTPYDFPYETEMQLHTRGAASVAFWWPGPDGVDGVGHPIGVGPDNELSWYGAGIAPVIVFDPVTNLVIDVYNTGSATVITKFTGGAGENANMYDPATKTIWVSWNYNNNPLRVFTDTLYYKGPR